MENSRKDSDISTTLSNTEIQFLQQVKECQQHFHHMQKLFFDLQNVQENKQQFEGSCTSMNEFNQSLSKSNISSNSISDLQSLMRELETRVNSKNSLFHENDFGSSQTEIPVNSQPASINGDDPLTFMVQVPNSILNVLKTKVSSEYLSDFSSECLSTKSCKKQKKAGLIKVLQRVFKRKKNNLLATSECKISQNVELLQLFRKQKCESISTSTQTSNEICTNYISTTKDTCIKEETNDNDNSTHTEIDSKSKNLKYGQTILFPITLNLNEESITMANPNLTIYQEIIPQNNSNLYSNSIKVTNKCSLQSTEKCSDTNDKETVTEKSKEYPKNEQLQPTELLLENLIKVLLKTTEKLDNLETTTALLESLNLKESKTNKSNESSKVFKTKNRKDSAVLNHLFQHVMGDVGNSVKELKPPPKKIQKIPKRQSSKLSICSSSGSASSDDELYKSPMILKPSQVRRYRRYHSPSRLNYLVCQSERDIDQKYHSKK